jgi:transmembrane sensor
MESNDTRERAAEWLVDLNTSDDVESLWPAFHAWLQQAPENRSTYLELEKVWRISERAMAPVGRVRSDAATHFTEEVRNGLAKRQRRLWTKLALGAGLYMGVLWLALALFVPGFWRDSGWNRYVTAYGEHRPVPLSDGSSIDLDTNSCVWVRISATSREVSLERGEALFTVAPDVSRPFTVKVDNDVFTALGTQFAVRREPAGVIKTFVLGGRVQVPNHSASPPITADAGFAVEITPTQTSLRKIGLSAVQQRVAWTQGKIIIDGTLADAVEEFNRYNTRRLEVSNPVYADRHIQGRFKATDPDAFAQTVQSILNIPLQSIGAVGGKTGVIRLGVMQ